MPSPTIYEFRFIDASAGGPAGAFAGGGTTAAAQRAAPQRQQAQPTTAAPRGQQQQAPQTSNFFRDVHAIIDRASQLPFVGRFAGRVSSVLRPFVNLASTFGVGGGGQKPPGARGTLPVGTAVASAAPTGPFNIGNAVMTIGKAVITIEQAAQQQQQQFRGGRPTPAPPSGGPRGGLPSVIPRPQLRLPAPTEVGEATRGLTIPRTQIVSMFVKSTARTAGQMAGAGNAAAAAGAGLGALAISTGVLVGAVAGMVLAVGLAIYAFKKLSDRANRQSESLARFSGPLAGAQAQATVSTIMQQVRSASQLGPQLAEMVKLQNQISIAQTRVADKFESGMLVLKNWGLGIKKGFWQALDKRIESMDKGIQKQLDMSKNNFWNDFASTPDLDVNDPGVSDGSGKNRPVFKLDAGGSGRIDWHP